MEVIDTAMKERLREAIGKNVLRLREGRELRQDQLANMIGITRIQLSRIENGHSEPTAAVLFAIADALKVTADSLRQMPIAA